MHGKPTLLLCAGLLFLLSGHPLEAAEQTAGAEVKLREALKTTMLQLRDAQAQLANLQGTQTDIEDKNKALEAKLKTLTSAADVDRLASEKAISDLKGIIPAKDGEIGKLKDELEKAKAAIEQKNSLITATEEKRRKFEERSILLDRRVADQQAKNLAIYKIGLEILGRYEKFGLGDAISAREPFIGKTRVKFENFVQDFQDKLAEQKIKPANAAQHARSSPAAPAKKSDAARPRD